MRSTPLTYFAPPQGLASHPPGVFLDERFYPRLDNAIVWAGRLLNRPALTAFAGALDGIPTGGHAYIPPSGSFCSLIATADKVFDYVAPAWNELQDYGGFGGFAATPSDPWVFATALGSAVFTNGVDKVWRWDGPGVDLGNGVGKIAEITASHPARYIESYANRVFIAHVNDGAVVGDRVRWCANGDVTVWSPGVDITAGFLDLVDTVGWITGMKSYGNLLYIFKRNSISYVQETGLTIPSFIKVDLPYGVGCLEGRTIVEAQGKLIFLGADDVYEWAPGSPPVGIASGIRSELFKTLNRGRIRQCFAFVHETLNQYWLFVPTGETIVDGEAGAWPQVAYVFNYVDRAWSKVLVHGTCVSHTVTTSSDILIIDNITFPINSWSTPIDGGLGGASVAFPLVGRITDLATPDGATFKLDENTTEDDEGAYEVVIETHDKLLPAQDSLPMNFTTNFANVRVVDRGPATYHVEISTNGGTAWTSLGTQVLAGTGDGGYIDLHYTARHTGASARLRITGTGAVGYVASSLTVLRSGSLR